MKKIVRRGSGLLDGNISTTERVPHEDLPFYLEINRRMQDFDGGRTNRRIMNSVL